MKRVKYLVLISLLIILTGCSPTVNITIKDNYKIEEQVLFEYDNIYEDHDSNDDYINTYLNYYNNLLKSKGYKVQYNLKDKTTEVEIFRNSESFCDTLNSSLLTHHLYDNFRCEEDSERIILESIGNQALSKTQKEREFGFNNLTVNIKLPLKAVESNADKVKGKVYTWEFDENTLPDKSIKLVLNKSKMELNKKTADFGEKNKNNILIISVSVIFIVLIVIAIRNLYKKYQETHDEY